MGGLIWGAWYGGLGIVGNVPNPAPKIRGEKVAEHESRASGDSPRVAREAGDERKERLQWFHTTIVKLFDSSCLSQLRPFFNMIP